jgi:hypothetical protein
MTQTVPVHSAAERTAWLGQNHGYRIAGDLACLNAEFAIAADAARATAEQWALQLWACDRPYVGGDLSGTKVAEAVLDVPNLAAAEPQRWYSETFARLPAGNRDYSMVLVLASRSAGASARDRVLDYANYPAREHFSVPSLRGAVSVELAQAQTELVANHNAQARAQLRVEGIENPRTEENLSGSLALELWALEEPYAGGQFVGEALAGVEIGTLAGQQSLQGLEYELSLTARDASPRRPAHLVLMLREWTAGGYVTRDYRNLPGAAAAAAVAVAPVTVIRDVNPAPAPVVEAPRPAAVAPSAVTPAAAKPSAAAAAPVAKPAIAPREVPREAAKPTQAQPVVAAKVALVSIQHASADELSAVEGLNRKLAAEIIKGRPYRSLDDLTRIRGIGDKILRKLRGVLTL